MDEEKKTYTPEEVAKIVQAQLVNSQYDKVMRKAIYRAQQMMDTPDEIQILNSIYQMLMQPATKPIIAQNPKADQIPKPNE
jgi:DNA replication initiation complex subunit (GINS family)